ncbi:MAG: glycosyltransferase, partial [Actinomycetota bacterium]|nr:glycosyltransferase [Actinomycetota bacterium]
PEPRLRYANAALPEVLLAAGSLLEVPEAPRWTEQGLTLLTWLVEQETRGDHLSVVPTGGWAAGEPRPGFDQQPIEVAALADAAARALDVTGDPVWHDLVGRCAAWFAGANDSGVDLRDPETGGGYDGLEPGGHNENEGAESTIALISTLQQAQRLADPSPSSPHPIASA